MDYNYEDILERMNDKYYELTGVEADSCGDIGIRLKLLAGELYSLNSNIDWLRRQMFPDTATGAELELHAAQRGLKRYEGTKAKGSILFKLDMPVEYDVYIPKGTVCTTADGSLNFIVLSDGYIERGGTFLYQTAEAEYGGKKYNVAPGAIKTIVTYFSVGLSITNSSSFNGGTDGESDEELRERLKQSLRNIPNGANKDYFVNLAKSVDGVYSAFLDENINEKSASIYIAGRGKKVSDEVFAKVQELIAENKTVGIDYIVRNPAFVDFNVDISIAAASGFSFEQAKENAQSAIQDFFNHLAVGESATVAALGAAVLKAEGVENYLFGSNMSDAAAIKSRLWRLGTVTITEYEKG